MMRRLLVSVVCLATVVAVTSVTRAAEEADFRLAKVRIRPQPGVKRIEGWRISGSNAGPTRHFVELAAVDAAIGEDGWVEVPIPSDEVYRYVKVEAVGAAKLALAEVEFYNRGGKLEGKPFGTAGEDDPDAWGAALDGDPATVFTSPIENAYVGLDLGGESQCPAPHFRPRCGVYAEPQQVELSVWPHGPAIRYTVDGSTPSETHGKVYSEPFAADRSLGIAAIAYQEGRAPSRVVIGAYAIGPQAADSPPVTSYHVGNSLTDTVVAWMEPLSWSTGKNYRFMRKSIPGCGLEGNWNSNGRGFGDSDYEKVLSEGVDHVFLQVFPNPPGLERDGRAGINFMKLAQQGNPDAQVWLYAQWPAEEGWHRDAHCVGAGWMTPEWYPSNRNPQNWDDAMLNKMEYYRATLEIWNESNTGKKALLCPGGPALLALKREIETGEVPGITDFGEMFADGLHMSHRGAYLISLVHYACLYGENPRGRVTFAGSGLTAQQADIFQRIAWETVTWEPQSGVKE